MTNRNRLLPLLALISVFAVILPLHAVEPIEPATTEPQYETWYQIEVLVYEPIEHAVANESWPATLGENKFESLIELAPITDSSALDATNTINTTDAFNNTIDAFQQLPPENLTLAETAGKLTQAGNYRIITLQGWQQPVKQRHEAEAVHLTDKQEISNEPDETIPTTLTPQGELVLNSPTEELIAPLEPLIDENGFVVEEIPARINGSVKVSLSRYLHMALNIRYYNPDVYLAEQIALQKPDEIIIDTFELRQSRRMRSTEVHVFDHPYFGVVATIIPVKRIIEEVVEPPALPLNTTGGQ
ncbi:MAG: hypothetical protein KAT25_08100 [Sulfuriflexus sp.]|nr:hypothetical protein [Sulfuriflexus sp.]